MNKKEKETTPLVLYKTEKKYQISPPATIKIFWFWAPEPLSSLQARGALEEIEERLESFCGEEGKKVKGSLFRGVDRRSGREESLIMTEVSRKPLSEQEKRILLMNPPEPPRRYPKKKIKI